MKRIIGAALTAILCSVLLGALPAPVHAASAPQDCQGLLAQVAADRDALDAADNYLAFMEAVLVYDNANYIPAWRNDAPGLVSLMELQADTSEYNNAHGMTEDAADQLFADESYAHEAHCM